MTKLRPYFPFLCLCLTHLLSKSLKWMESYKYLGVTVAAMGNCVSEYEEELHTKAVALNISIEYEQGRS